MSTRKWLFYMIAAGLTLLYYAASLAGLDFVAMLVILPVGCWLIWNLNPDKPQS